MTYDEAIAITGKTDATVGVRNTGATYWLASANTSTDDRVGYVSSGGVIHNVLLYCYGVRPVVSLTSGVYIASGEGTEESPYVLGKDIE